MGRARAASGIALDPVLDALTRLVPGGVRRRAVAAGGRYLRWIEAGREEPVVVLEAGAGDTALAWAPILRQVAERTRLVAYDRAGLGRSDPPPASPTMAAQAADLVALIGAAATGSCILVGHSWGGILVQAVASERPDLVAALVLVDPAQEDLLPVWVRKVAVPLLTRALPPLQRLLVAWGGTERLERGAARRWADGVSCDRETRRLLAEAYLHDRTGSRGEGRARESRAVVGEVEAIRGLRGRAIAADLPLIVLSGTRGVPLHRSRWTAAHAALVAARPGAQHVAVQGAGHGVHWDRPAPVAGAVLAMVDRLRREQKVDRQADGEPTLPG
ncbi:MAG TPA: alpha/beta hydrolase [Candidatus Dormibacteraeota bacterium]|jgi:pimeloyl-ACP methyl ester carboxylesterase|nr:alpha/beta hydrolase [Candidatus Dormibacteraeota bacterium]